MQPNSYNHKVNQTMEKRNLKVLAAVAVTGLILGGCGLSKMVKNADQIQYTVTPDPLEMHGDSIEVTINGKFPPKYFNKKVKVTVTPTLIWDGGEKAMEPIEFKGEKADGNGMVVPYVDGKSFSYTDKIPYVDGMDASDYTVIAIGYKGNKEAEFDPWKIADATIVTPFWVQGDDMILLGDDKFTRITKHTQDMILNYDKNKSFVRSGEDKDDDAKAMVEFLKWASADEKITPTGVSINAYASPEGEIALNDNLANERSESAAGWLAKAFKKQKLEMGTDATDGFYNLVGRGEDWDGFKDLVSKSNGEDADLILSVLQKYSDVNQREQEIRNMAKTYEWLEDEILPELRRSVMVVNYEIMGKSDEEITALAKSNPDSLNVEELLYAATLTNDINEKLRIYKEVSRIFPDDWRGPNNVGYIYMMQNNMSSAKAEFEKSNKIEENDVATNNLGCIARLEGDRTKAKDLLGRAKGAGPEVSYNLGICAIQDGDYESATSWMGNYNTFNTALGFLLLGNNDKALEIVNASDDAETAAGYYLKAIIGARTNNNDLLINNLKAACNADGSLKAMAKEDREFLKFWDNSDFQSIVN